MAQKTVLITGCSEGGIGDALAKTFHAKGLRVFATARNLAKVQHLKAMGMEILPLDVIDEASIKAIVESVKTLTGGTLDFLVNNSGMGMLKCVCRLHIGLLNMTRLPGHDARLRYVRSEENVRLERLCFGCSNASFHTFTYCFQGDNHQHWLDRWRFSNTISRILCVSISCHFPPSI